MRIQPYMYAVILAVTFTTVPAFAQAGLGAAVGVAGQHAGVGAGAGAGVGAGAGAGAQAGTNAGVNAGVNSGAKARVENQTGPVGVQAESADRVATRIQSHPEVAARVQSMLPAGMSVKAASAGFKNEGQFIAALHASQNLSIPFDQLKARMTGSASTSLGAAIQASKPGISDKQAKTEAKKAEAQAKTTASAKAATSASFR